MFSVTHCRWRFAPWTAATVVSNVPARPRSVAVVGCAAGVGDDEVAGAAAVVDDLDAVAARLEARGDGDAGGVADRVEDVLHGLRAG